MKKNPYSNKALQITKPAKKESVPMSAKIQKGKDLRSK